MRRKIRIGRATPEARKIKLKRAIELKEEMLRVRVRVQTNYGQNVAPMKKEQLLVKCEKTNKKLKSKSNRKKAIQEKKEMSVKKSTKKNNADCDELENWQESFAMRLGITESEDKLQPIVKHEPILEADDFRKKNAPLQDSIELSEEMKVEYDCVTDGDTIYSINPILIKDSEDKLSLQQLESSPSTLSPLPPLEILLSSGTKFSKMAPIKTNNEALRCIKLLETFALSNENYRLIGFIERLQKHFEKKTLKAISL